MYDIRKCLNKKFYLLSPSRMKYKCTVLIGLVHNGHCIVLRSDCCNKNILFSYQQTTFNVSIFTGLKEWYCYKSVTKYFWNHTDWKYLIQFGNSMQVREYEQDFWKQHYVFLKYTTKHKSFGYLVEIIFNYNATTDYNKLFHFVLSSSVHELGGNLISDFPLFCDICRNMKRCRYFSICMLACMKYTMIPRENNANKRDAEQMLFFFTAFHFTARKI
jgi:hypothetical protein